LLEEGEGFPGVPSPRDKKTKEQQKRTRLQEFLQMGSPVSQSRSEVYSESA
ncbi:uncharacterized protein METZ01_LOCUS182328, partial [marine metagenome]